MQTHRPWAERSGPRKVAALVSSVHLAPNANFAFGTLLDVIAGTSSLANPVESEWVGEWMDEWMSESPHA